MFATDVCLEYIYLTYFNVVFEGQSLTQQHANKVFNVNSIQASITAAVLNMSY